jgi:hypothetical protein
MKEKTAIIWAEDTSLTYFVLDGDFRQFHQVYIGGNYEEDVEKNEELEEGLDKLMFVSGDHKHSPVTLDQLADAVRAGAYLIECGQLF